MRCDAPPPLSDEEINAALDGAPPPETIAHLERCSGCRARLVEAQQLDRALQRKLHRWDCPPSETLAEYHLGLLDTGRERSVTWHVQNCVRCAAELEELRLFLLEETPAMEPVIRQPAVPWRPHAILARLLPSGPRGQLAAVRGEGGVSLIAQSSAATIVLEPRLSEPAQVLITGQIADDAGEQDRWQDALVEMRQAGVLIATAFVDDLGAFSMGPVEHGSGELQITASDGTSIVIEDLAL